MEKRPFKIDSDKGIPEDSAREVFLEKAEILAKKYNTTPESVMMLYALSTGKHVDKYMDKEDILQRIYTDELEDDLLWDTTEIILQKEAAERLAMTDSLTGLPNREALNNTLNELAKRHTERGTTFSVILFDLDHFKSINDTYGHDKGDEILKTVAKIMKAHTRKNDLAFRYGGEEFGMVVDDTKNNAIQMAERLRLAINNTDPQSLQLGEPISGSFGVAEYNPLEGEEIESATKHLLKQADEAMYVAKRNGRNRVTNYGPELTND